MAKDTETSRRRLTATLANRAYAILVKEAGASPSKWDKLAFRVYVTNEQGYPHEYRFMGSLGFGGKFRVRQYGPPTVDCYPEDLTPEREAVIERTNAALALLPGHWQDSQAGQG